MREFDHSLAIDAPPARCLDAFFDSDALAAWWHVTRSLCQPRPLGSYAVEWAPTEWQDDVLGRLGGAFRGTVIDFKPGREFFVADAYWLPPDGEPIGPMALEVTLHDAWRARRASRAPVRLGKQRAVDALLRAARVESDGGAQRPEDARGDSPSRPPRQLTRSRTGTCIRRRPGTAIEFETDAASGSSGAEVRRRR